MNPIYIHQESVHNLKAPREVVPLIVEMLHPKSIIDIGCGTGTWLKAFEEKGISDYVGIDGDYVRTPLLKIPESKFIAKNLQNPFFLGRKFDLVISLEVAEHLDEKYAGIFVETLVNHGDNILFSAAIPGQGGQNHLNEQWPQYWQEKFSKHGYYFQDCIRPLIWNNTNVDWWYKQNTFIISRNHLQAEIVNSVHPDLFAFRISELKHTINSITNGELGISHSLHLLLKSIIKSSKMWL